MRRPKIGRILVICGVLMVVFAMGALPAQGAGPALPQAQPSPRPTLMSTATPPDPTATPTASSDDSGSQPGDPPAPTGRITGTIIDLSSGAPAPGIAVDIGGVIVTSDANGNYDRWLPIGAYSVALILSPEQGEPAQGPQTANLTEGATVVLHLNFRSPLQASATPVPATSTPVMPTPVPATQAPVIPTAARVAGSSAQVAPPSRLPVTAGQSNGVWLWLAFGAMLLAVGGALEFSGMLGRSWLPAGALRHSRTPPSGGAARRAPAPGYENARLLATLLAEDRYPQPAPSRPARGPAPDSTDLLAALLCVDGEEGGREP